MSSQSTSNKKRLTAAIAVGFILVTAAIVSSKPAASKQASSSTVVLVSPPRASTKASTPTVIKVDQLDVDSSQVVMFEEDVNYTSVGKAISQLKAVLKSNDKAYLFIDSPGGSVFDGAKLLAFIEGSKKPVYTVCVGMCASMGFHIFEAGKKRYMTTNAVLMTHPAAGGLRGTVPEMKALLELIERFTAAMDAKIAKRAGLSKEQFELMNLRNSWLMADEALGLRLADSIVNVDVQEGLF